MKKIAIIVSGLLSLLISVGTAQTNTVGVVLNSTEVYPGYTLFSPTLAKTTFLIDNEGKLIHSWESEYEPGLSTYLLEDGMLYRAGIPKNANMPGAGAGGLIEKIDWDNNVVWSFRYASDSVRQHHDFEVLPNGNVLLIAWKAMSEAYAVEQGRDPSNIIYGKIWVDHIVEVQPQGLDNGVIVWEWHIMDHLIQDYNESKNNFGVVVDHPELVNFNHVNSEIDWNHSNSIDYNVESDQIVLSVRSFNELWVIDHSTTTEEAKGHIGGNSGKGGDLLFRWGNPRAYNRGTNDDQEFYGQHDVHWIPKGLPNEGSLLIFNNGDGRPNGNKASIDILTPTTDISGNYVLENNTFAPKNLNQSILMSISPRIMSGSQQLPNGNFLVCDSPVATFLEINSSNEVLWKYVSPVTAGGMAQQGDTDVPAVLQIFNAKRYPIDYPAFVGRDLTPGDHLEQPALEVLSIAYPNKKFIDIYPNPASNTVQFNFEGQKQRIITIYDTSGQVKHQISSEDLQLTLDTTDWSRGVYIISSDNYFDRFILL